MDIYIEGTMKTISNSTYRRCTIEKYFGHHGTFWFQYVNIVIEK